MKPVISSLSGFALVSVSLHTLGLGSVYVMAGAAETDAPVEEVSNRISLGLKASQAGETARITEPPVKKVVRKPAPEPDKTPPPAPGPKPEPVKSLPAPEQAERESREPEEKKDARQNPSPAEAPEDTVMKPPAPEATSQVQGHQGTTGSKAEPVDKQDTGEANEEGAKALEAAYDLVVMRRLKSEKRYPTLAKRRRQEGPVRVSFTIDRSGELVADVPVSASAEHSLLEKSVREQVRRAAPFPAPPAEVGWRERAYTVTITFSLKNK